VLITLLCFGIGAALGNAVGHKFDDPEYENRIKKNLEDIDREEKEEREAKQASGSRKLREDDGL